jgi:prevent-host-death family protein
MPTIRPVSDLRNHFAEITKEVQNSKEPVFLTKNGVGSIVVMSMEAYEEGRYESQVYDKLLEAEVQAAATTQRFSHADVMTAARKLLEKAEGSQGA